jgi:hypothetical protein
MMHMSNIREHMPVVDRNNEQLGMVDKVEGDRVKLTKDESGRHHYIPADWIDDVDDAVQLGRSLADTRAEWQED